MQQIREDSWNFVPFLSNPFLALIKSGRYKKGILFLVFWIFSLVKKVGITFKSLLIEIIQLAMFRQKEGFKKNFLDLLDELKGKNLKIRKMKFYSHLLKQYTILTSMSRETKKYISTICYSQSGRL
jgi:uncharacterized membrane protein